MSLRRSFWCLTALTLQMLQTLCGAHGTFGPTAQKDFARPGPGEASRHLNTSALNTLLAFEPYQALASAEPEAPQQPNILFSPLGLASAAALLSRVSGPERRSQALTLLGLAAGSPEQSVEDTLSALTNLLHNLTLPEEGEGAGAWGGAGDNGSSTDAAEAATHAGSQLKVWSRLQADGKQADHQSFPSGNQRGGSSNASDTDSQVSDKLNLRSYAYFKGRSFPTG